MSKLGSHRKAWKVQRSLNCELPAMGKPGALERRPYPPGQHGMARRKFSEYSLRLKEKQKLVFNYCLREEQLRRLVRKAKAGKATDWMSTLVGLLETRIDNVVFRLGFAQSVPAARQLVSHRKVLVNGKRLTIGSAQVPVGAIVSLTPDAYKSAAFQSSLKQPRLMLPDWLELDNKGETATGRLKFIPDVYAAPFPFEGRLVAEFYTGI